jgi:hypothetical protein
MRRAPRSVSNFATVLLPVAMPPVSPMFMPITSFTTI